MDCYCEAGKTRFYKLFVEFGFFLYQMLHDPDAETDSMVIEHIINNNIISAIDGKNEIVVSGRGIGFGRHKGDTVDDAKIEKVYRMDNEEQMGRFKDLLTNIPLEYLKISDEIITEAGKKLNVELNQNIYVTLTDHINFALERYDKGMDFENILTQEVSDYYPNEFRIGLNAVELIRRETGKDLKRDEAASIALHIVSAELNTRMSVAFGLTQMVKQMLAILQEDLDAEDPGNKDKTEEIIPHFKHFAYRVIADQQYEDDDTALYGFVREHYPSQFKCGEQIAEYVREKFGKEVTKEEMNHMVMTLKHLKFLEKEGNKNGTVQ